MNGKYFFDSGLPFNLSSLSYGNVGASDLTRGGGTSSYHDTTNDITTNYGVANTNYFYIYKDGNAGFIFGGANDANLSGKYWIGTFYYQTDSSGGGICTGVPTFDTSSTSQTSVSFSKTGLTAGQATLHQTNAANVYLAWSAEL